LFGSSSTGTGSGLFGSSANTGSSLFGSSTTSAFGSGSSSLGTKQAAWVETNQQEKNKKTGMKTLQLQSISGMQQYKTKSHEELRLEDLFNTAFSKPGTATTSGFGSSGMFGSTNTSTGGGLFGNSTSTGSSIFGSSGTSSGGLFGSSGNTSSGFGGFGSSTTSGGLFGSKPATTSGGLFGSSSTNTSGGLFGSTNNSGGGLFGSSSSTTNTGGGLFGSNTSSGGGLFGSSNTNKSTSLFGNSSSGGLFGSNNNTSGGLFGSNNNSSGGLFGSSNTNTGSSLFGNSSSSGGLFGNNNKSNSLFGNNNSSGSLFGSSNNSGGLFGNNNSNTSSIFGNSTMNTNNSNINTGLIAQANANPYAINLELAKEQVTNYTACPTKKVTIVRKVQPVETPRFGFVPRLYQPKRNFLKSSLMNEAGAFRKPPVLASSVLYSNRDTSFNRDSQTSYDWRRQYQKLSSRRTLQPLPLPEPPKLKPCSLDDQNPAHFEPFDEEEKQHHLKSTAGSEGKKEQIADAIVERVRVAQGQEAVGDVSPVRNFITKEAAKPTVAAEDVNPTGFKGDPTPKLSNPEMRTDPKFKDLCTMTERQLASVADFEIEHVQYGQIKWDHPVDLRGVNLDEIVRFSQSAFELYPNMDPKPEFGTGFMTPCAVMLYNVWPKGYDSVDRPSLQREERWRTSLEKHCRSCGYHDISYEDGVLEFSTNRDILMLF